MLNFQIFIASHWEEYFGKGSFVTISYSSSKQKIHHPANYAIKNCEFLKIDNHAVEFKYATYDTHVLVELCSFYNCTSLNSVGGSFYYGDSGSCITKSSNFVGSKGFGGIAFYITTDSDGLNIVDGINVLSCGTSTKEGNCTLYFGNCVNKFQNSNVSNNNCEEFVGIYLKASNIQSEFQYSTFINNTQEKSILIYYEGESMISFAYCSFIQNVQNLASNDSLIYIKSGNLTLYDCIFHENVASKPYDCRDCFLWDVRHDKEMYDTITRIVNPS
ncbi:hypothetical protein TVAG_364120 [Trichomonas vaginalis G3]|uniref:Uncharacterized protein n=1 Tax=Trichomonas vaginalis (strain ATCC PRA-98 / G3) TaxID=412133 RepID=A2E9C5_TRIV3|nr:hypothetical protein TVAGG3_0000600 [Trichomonas vaginalis G3]EAY10689.1 hypothetical protein TVAG_364120 [Trichomonas vaginalis G3]KAI5538582.1 hypothetical protein TVAGG3_0000600 [Trichomonas vaginalis G3]|eukprot:XP_001322912.1 hypothetical protein [Trichomonas vaginalis G3]